MAYPSKPVFHGVSTPDSLGTNLGLSKSASLSTLDLLSDVLLGAGCLYSAFSLLAAGALALQVSEAEASGELLAIVFMVSNAVASNGFLIASISSQALTTVALGEPCALSIPSICGQALVFLGLGIARVFRTSSVLGPMKMISITDLPSVVLTYLAFWWLFMDCFAVAAGQLFILMVFYWLSMNSKTATGEGSL